MYKFVYLFCSSSITNSTPWLHYCDCSRRAVKDEKDVEEDVPNSIGFLQLSSFKEYFVAKEEDKLGNKLHTCK